MKITDHPEALLRFLTSWPDKVLAEDWHSALGSGHDDLVQGYVRLRRKAPGWNARRDDLNSHHAIPVEHLEPLLNPTPVRREVTCSHCGEDFMAARNTRRFCSDACRVASYRENKAETAPGALSASAYGTNSGPARESPHPGERTEVSVTGKVA